MENIIRYFMENCIRNLFDTKLELYKDTTDLAGFVIKVQEEVQDIVPCIIKNVLRIR